MSLSAAVVDGVGPGVEVNVLGRVSGESLGSGQSGLEGRLEGRLDWGSRGWPEGGLSWSGGLEGRLEGLLGRLLIAPDGNVGASVATLGSGSANDVGTSAVDVDGLRGGLNKRGSNLLDGLGGLDGGSWGNDEALSGWVESSLRGGSVFNLPQLSGVVVVAVLALDLSSGVPAIVENVVEAEVAHDC